MAKKLMVLAAALAAVAVMAVPAAASAAPTLKENGVTIPDTTSFEVTGTAGSTQVTNPLHTVTALGDLVCKKIMLGATVGTNNATSGIAATGTPSQSTAEECTLKGEPATVSEIALLSVKSTTSGSGTFEASYAAAIPGGITCKFTNKGTPGNITYTAGTDILKVQPTEVLSAACGESELTGEVTLETKDKTTVTIG